MAPAVGERIADYRLLAPLARPPGAWRVAAGDGAEVVLVPRPTPDAPAWPPGLFHPSLVAPIAHLPAWDVRPGVDEPLGSEVDTLPVRDLFAAGSRLAEGLAVLHGAGVAHGNVTPHSIAIGDRRRPRLLDPVAGGRPEDDVAALAAVLLGWLGPDASTTDRQLLEAAPARGWSALELRDRLDDARLAGHAPPLADVAVAVTGEAPAPVDDVARHRNRWMAGAAALAVLALVATWLLLPAGEPAPAAPAAATRPAPAASVEAAPEPLTEAELETLLTQRREAEAVLDAFIQLQLAQEERAVERWGAEPFAAAQALARDAEAPFREQDYVAAKERYEAALAAMGAVAEFGDATLDQALADGAEALATGRAEAAREAFELALAIDPDHATAKTGLARTATLDAAFALQTRAELAEAEGRLDAALAAWEELLTVDPLMPGADAGPPRVRELMRERDFRQAMSDGLAALEIQDWGGARERFLAAARLRPDDPAPVEFAAEAERHSREFVIASHRRKAEAALAREAWDEAIAHFEALLQRQPRAEVAIDGLALARGRAELYGALEGFVAAPRRWWSDAGREQARALLAQAATVAAGSDEPTPRLAALRDELADLLAAAEQPVTVTLRSDNACSVVVYKVARLGTFEERQLSLKPGQYTAIGTRSGYRDVRKEFLVPADARPAAVTLRCEEPV